MGKGRAFTFKEKPEKVSLVGRISSFFGHADFFSFSIV